MRPPPAARWRGPAGLRARLILFSLTVVLATAGLSWFVTSQQVLRPLDSRFEERQLRLAAFVAEDVEAGAAPESLADSLGMKGELAEAPPAFVTEALAGRSKECRAKNVQTWRMVVCTSPRDPIAVDTADGWLLLSALGPPVFGPPLLRSYLLLAFAVSLTAVLIAFSSTRPVRASVSAMERIAEGQLDHRLPPAGGELGSVATAFNRMADRVETLLQAERQLMASVSHELRTPLARLRLAVELLRDQGLPEKRLDAMEEDLEELNALIEEQLEASRLAIGDQPLHLGPVDLNAIVDEAIARSPLPKHSVRRVGSGAKLSADGPRLVRAIRNLIQNAGKYTPAGTEIEVCLDGHSVEVRDGGPGVPEEDLPHLFEPFYRSARDKKNRSATGVGLGLMIVSEVLRLHGGAVSAKNRPEGGLSIRLELPS